MSLRLDAVERFTRPALAPYAADPKESDEPRILQFSDSIVRIRRVQTEPNLNYPTGLVFQELLDLVHAQGDLIREGVLLRGGVSYGSVYASDVRVFGPALVAAYELESRFALYPRIVVDPMLLAELRNNTLLKSVQHEFADEEHYVKQLLRRGDDGIWFVDYIRAIESELDDIDMYPAFLETHRELILNGARRFAGLSGPMSKYLWLASYHNEGISELKAKWFKHYGLKRENLMVSTKDLNVLQELHSNIPAHQMRRNRRR